MQASTAAVRFGWLKEWHFGVLKAKPLVELTALIRQRGLIWLLLITQLLVSLMLMRIDYLRLPASLLAIHRNIIVTFKRHVF